MQESLKQAIIKAGLASFFVFLCYIFVTVRKLKKDSALFLSSTRICQVSDSVEVFFSSFATFQGLLACLYYIFCQWPRICVSFRSLAIVILIYCSGDVLVWQEPEDMEREAGFQFQRSRIMTFHSGFGAGARRIQEICAEKWVIHQG